MPFGCRTLHNTLRNMIAARVADIRENWSNFFVGGTGVIPRYGLVCRGAHMLCAHRMLHNTLRIMIAASVAPIRDIGVTFSSEIRE